MDHTIIRWKSDLTTEPEDTLFIMKPSSREHFDEILKQFILPHGFRVKESMTIQFTDSLCDQFYQEHVKKRFYPMLKSYMLEGKSIVMILEKRNGILELRKLLGDTNPFKARDGTLRKKYGKSLTKNGFHGSANAEDAKREIFLLFGKNYPI